MNDADLLNKVGQFAAPMVLAPDITSEDAVRIGAAFLAVAETIFKQIGGRELAAQQFYLAADRCASPFTKSGGAGA